MEFEDNYIKRIEAYLDNEMTMDEKAKFEDELKKDKKLRKELKLHQDIRKAFRHSGKEDIKQKLESYYQDYKKAKSRRKTYTILIPVMSAAATILILLMIYSGKNEITEPSDEFITLDSSKINKDPNYADSANYELKIEKDTIK